MSNTANFASLFQSAAQQGIFTQQSMNAFNLVDDGASLQYALGGSTLDIQTSEVVLVSVMVDDSGSIRFASNADAVRTGHNGVIEALMASKSRDGILFFSRLLNPAQGKEVIYPYGPLDMATRLDTHNYDPRGGTPLYDESVAFLKAVSAKVLQCQDDGIYPRTISLIVTDGHDESSFKQTARNVAAVVKDLLMQETNIVAAMGIDDGTTDFNAVFKEMGIRDEWILTPGNSPSEIRKAFNVFSQSAVRASQTAASFSQTSMGGFGNP